MYWQPGCGAPKGETLLRRENSGLLVGKLRVSERALLVQRCESLELTNLRGGVWWRRWVHGYILRNCQPAIELVWFVEDEN